jgi:hypothetical protein
VNSLHRSSNRPPRQSSEIINSFLIPGERVTIGKVQTDIDDLTMNIYREATGDTQPELEIIESPSPISNLSDSFDPYDSGSFKVLRK